MSDRDDIELDEMTESLDYYSIKHSKFSRLLCTQSAQCREILMEDVDDELSIKNEEIVRLREERDQYEDAFGHTIRRLKEVLNPSFAIANLWSEFVSNIMSVCEVYGGLANDGVYDIWTFMTENSLEDKIELARAQSKMRRVFPIPGLDFLILIKQDDIETEIPEYMSKIYSYQ